MIRLLLLFFFFFSKKPIFGRALFHWEKTVLAYDYGFFLFLFLNKLVLGPYSTSFFFFFLNKIVFGGLIPLGGLRRPPNSPYG